MPKMLGISWLRSGDVDPLNAVCGREIEDAVGLHMSLGNSPTCFHYGDNEVIYLLHRGGTEIISIPWKALYSDYSKNFFPDFQCQAKTRGK